MNLIIWVLRIIQTYNVNIMLVSRVTYIEIKIHFTNSMQYVKIVPISLLIFISD